MITLSAGGFYGSACVFRAEDPFEDRLQEAALLRNEVPALQDRFFRLELHQLIGGNGVGVLQKNDHIRKLSDLKRAPFLLIEADLIAGGNVF